MKQGLFYDVPMADEEWKPVVGYEGYYSVSNFGRVRSEARTVVMKDGVLRPIKEAIKKIQFSTAGYPSIVLHNGNVYKNYSVHLLMMIAFNGPRPEGLQCAHNDGDPKNCVLSNLRWATPKENMLDRVIHGTANRGERHGMSKLTREDVLCIRQDQRKRSEIAKQYGILAATVGRIKRRMDWSWLS